MTGHTEEQALDAVCPQTLGTKSELYSACAGSVCMAWRWLPQGLDRDTLPITPDDKGYCGLAGKP